MIAKLVVELNGATQSEHALEKERVVIGRRQENEIQIDSLEVSGRHAMVLTVRDDSFLEDLGSTNGTYLNGKLVRKQHLEHGDVIRIGQHDLKYLNEAISEPVDDEFEKTVILKPSSAVSASSTAKLVEMAGGAEGKTKADFNAPLGRLKVLNGPSAGKHMNLTKSLITLGKPGKQVAAISRRPQGYYLTHIESDGDGKRYPVVNGSPIGSKAHQLKNQDKIELAGIQLEFSFPNS